MKAKIIRPDYYSGDKIVKLKATVTSGDVTKVKFFDFLVRKALRTEDQALAEDERYIKANIPAKIKEDVLVMQKNVLPAGCTVVWSTANSDYLTSGGNVTRPDFGLIDEEVTITATLTNGEQTKEVVIKVHVLALTDEDELSAATKRLTWDLIKNKNTDKARITTDLNLVTEIDEVEVAWESSNPNYVAIDGKVTRPEYTESDVTATLTARLTKGAKKSVVSFTGLKVLKKSASAQQRVEEYVRTPEKWEHWVTANGTNENTGIDYIKESFILPAEQEDMMLTWALVNSSGEPTTNSYFSIEYQDDSTEEITELSGISTFSANRRYVATVTRPTNNKVAVNLKCTAEISETEIEDVQVPGGSASHIHQLIIIGEDQDVLTTVDEFEGNEGRATWSANLHKELKGKATKSAALKEEVQK